MFKHLKKNRNLKTPENILKTLKQMEMAKFQFFFMYNEKKILIFLYYK